MTKHNLFQLRYLEPSILNTVPGDWYANRTNVPCPVCVSIGAADPKHVANLSAVSALPYASLESCPSNFSWDGMSSTLHPLVEPILIWRDWLSFCRGRFGQPSLDDQPH